MSAEEQFGHGVDDRLCIEAVGAVEIVKVAGLTEAVGAERTDPLAPHPAKPSQRGGRAVEQAGWRRLVRQGFRYPGNRAWSAARMFLHVGSHWYWPTRP